MLLFLLWDIRRNGNSPGKICTIALDDDNYSFNQYFFFFLLFALLSPPLADPGSGARHVSCRIRSDLPVRSPPRDACPQERLMGFPPPRPMSALARRFHSSHPSRFRMEQRQGGPNPNIPKPHQPVSLPASPFLHVLRFTSKQQPPTTTSTSTSISNTEIRPSADNSYTPREDAIVRSNRRLAAKKNSPLEEAFPPSFF